MSSCLPPVRSRLPHVGFTLVELLIVMGVIVILMTLLRPAFISITQGQNFAGSVYDVDYLVRQAKAAAMAQNTFVWLGFRSTNSDGTPLVVNGSPALVVVMVASRTGLSSAIPPSATPTPTPGLTSYQLIAKPMILQNVALDPTADSQGNTLPPYKSLSGFDSTNNVDVSPSASAVSYTFLQPLPGVSATATAPFTAVVGFSPDGAASLGITPIARTIGIGLKAGPAGAVNAQIAAVQISGLNGRSTVFRQ